MQIGRFCDRQKARVHWVQDEEAARFCCRCGCCWVAVSAEEKKEGMVRDRRDF